MTTDSIQESTRDGRPPRDRLLQAARTLFLRQGYRKTTVAQLCEYAGLSRPTFYARFPGKAEILAALAHQTAAEAVDKWRDDLRRTHALPARIRYFCRAYLALCRENPIITLPHRDPDAVIALGAGTKLVRPAALLEVWRTEVVTDTGADLLATSVDDAAWVTLTLLDGLLRFHPAGNTRLSALEQALLHGILA